MMTWELAIKFRLLTDVLALICLSFRLNILGTELSAHLIIIAHFFNEIEKDHEFTILYI